MRSTPTNNSSPAVREESKTFANLVAMRTVTFVPDSATLADKAAASSVMEAMAPRERPMEEKSPALSRNMVIATKTRPAQMTKLRAFFKWYQQFLRRRGAALAARRGAEAPAAFAPAAAASPMAFLRSVAESVGRVHVNGCE